MSKETENTRTPSDAEKLMLRIPCVKGFYCYSEKKFETDDAKEIEGLINACRNRSEEELWKNAARLFEIE